MPPWRRTPRIDRNKAEALRRAIFHVLPEARSSTTFRLGEGESAATLNYGMFIDTVINFLIVALAVFFLIKGINSLKKKEEEKPAEPPKPSAEETLLTEIRDLLAKN